MNFRFEELRRSPLEISSASEIYSSSEEKFTGEEYSDDQENSRVCRHRCCNSIQKIISQEVKNSIQTFTDQLDKKEELILNCFERISKSLLNIDKYLSQPRPTASNILTSNLTGNNSKIDNNENQLGLQRFQWLPIPVLTTDRDYFKWFSLYECVMGVKDERILKMCLVYYLDDDLVDLYIEISARTYRNIKRSLFEMIKNMKS